MKPQTNKPPPKHTPEVTKKVYVGSALAKQEPAKLSVTGQMKQANVAISAALKGMADLMSEDMPLPALAGAQFLMRKEWGPILERLDKAATAALKEHVSKEGAPSKSEGGGEVRTEEMDFSGAKFRCITTQSLAKLPDLKELCALTGLKESQLTVQVVSHEFSQDKLDKLLAEGKVTQEQVDSCRKAKSVSLKVEKI